ncbi:MAG: hypothetical protein QG670_1331 [Thermoproteota archaeon]|nr:hypothetical protein [Thermoproteota archaeon]
MAIAGIVSKKGEEISSKIVDMLAIMTHTKNSIAAFSLNEEIISKETTKSLEQGNTKGLMSVGYCGYPNEKGEYSIKALQREDGRIFIVGEGRTYFDRSDNQLKDRNYAISTVETIAHVIEEEHIDLLKRLTNCLSRINGFFSLAILTKEGIIVSRDTIGVEPLYWGENEDCCAIASERKALWRIGIKDVKAFPPGNISLVSKNGCIFSQPSILKKSSRFNMNIDNAAQELKSTLQRVITTYLGELDEIGVLFSGGIDSSLVAKMAGDLGLNVVLYTAGVEGSHDIDVAEKVADELGYDHYTNSIAFSSVEKYISKVVYAIEEERLMSVTVGFPLYAAAELASIQDNRLVLSGEGSDELFGGYSKYQRILQKSNYERLDEEMWRDILLMSEVNLQRDSAIAKASNIELLPIYMDMKVVDLAMSLPPQLKVVDGMDTLRKQVLRRTAKMVNLPDDVIYLPKKAAQYGSGSYKAIRTVARIRGFKNPHDYIKAIFGEVFKGFIA